MAVTILILLNSSKFPRTRKASLMRRFILVVVFCSAMVLSKTYAEELQWPSFLGAGKSSIEEGSLPITWGVKQNKAWEVDLPGHGQSSPVIFGNHIFVTAISGNMKDSNHVMMLDLQTGDQEWIFSKPTSNKAKNSVYISRAAPTPTVDKDGLYAFFESGDILALSFVGDELWSRCLTDTYGPIQSEFGIAASPVQHEDRLVFLVDNDSKSYLVALSKKDGHTLWCSTRENRTSWSSPAIVTLDGKAQIICSSAGSIDSYDIEDGSLLWSFEHVSGNTVATPIDYGTNTILIGASAGRDGGNAKQAQESNMVLTAKRVDGIWKPEKLWAAEKANSSFGSPLYSDGNVYWVNRAGVVFCCDFKTGKQCYSQRITQSCWATPLTVGDRIYFFGKSGITDVVETGPEFKLLSSNELWDSEDEKIDSKLIDSETEEQRKASARMFAGRVQYGIAAVTGSLIIRTGDKLFCIRKELSGQNP